MTEISRDQPPGFQTVDHPGAQVLSRMEVTPWVRYILESGEELHGVAGADRDVFALEGRAPVYVIPAKLPRNHKGQAATRWAVRRFVRGGRLLPKLLGDRYLRTGTPRPFHEAMVSDAARERGVPTPRVMAAAVYWDGPFYRGDLVTEFVPDAPDLVEALFDTRRKGAGGALERMQALRASGALVRTMASAGLQHRDLNASNILLQWKGTAPQGMILDLDLSRLYPAGTPAALGPMARRLERSLRKWEGHTGLRLSEREWRTLRGAMEE